MTIEAFRVLPTGHGDTTTARFRQNTMSQRAISVMFTIRCWSSLETRASTQHRLSLPTCKPG